MEAVLRTAADGLQFFATFVPRAASVAERAGTGDRFPTYDEIEARYLEQSDIRLDALAADIDVVTRVAADIDRRCDDQERVRSAVAQAWQGQASDTADAHLAEHLTRAARLQQDLDDVRCALVEADRVLREAATRKAEWVASLDPTRACGRTVAEVDAIVETAVRFGSAADDAANWAVDVFLARVRDTTAQFVDLCDETEFTVDEVFRNLDAVFCTIDDSVFQAPARIAEVCSGAEAPEPQPCSQPPSAPTTLAACATESTSPPPTSSLAGLTCAGTGAASLQTGVAPTAPAGTRPPVQTPVPVPGVTVGAGGSLAIEDAVRAAGAIVGTVAQVALGIVGEVVAEVTGAVRGSGSLDLDSGPDAGPGCACDCECSCGADAPEVPPAPEPEPPAPAPEPAPEPEPVAEPEPAPATAVPEPEPEPDCPEPEPDCPEPEPQPEPPAPADYCAPTGEPAAENALQTSPGTPTPGAAPSNPVRGTKPSVGTPSPGVAGAVDPTLAEVGPPAPGGDDQGVALAEAGAM